MLNIIYWVAVFVLAAIFIGYTIYRKNWRQWVWIPKVVTRRFQRSGNRR